MTDAKRSARNPFRTPVATPNPTGASSSAAQASAEPMAGLAALPSSSNNPRGDGRAPGQTESDEQRSVGGLAAELAATTLDEPPESAEPPPAYTPSADMYQGEATVEYGPARPFQPAPPPLALPAYLSPHPTGMSQGSYFVGPQFTGRSQAPIAPNPTGSWGNYPGQGARGAFGPPPRHPSTRGRGGEPRSTRSAERPLSEFARDFYTTTPDAGRGLSPARSDGSSGPDDTGPEHFERAGPPRSPRPSYTPPSGPPPPAASSSSSYAPPSGPPPPPPEADAVNPTSAPTPGRPLLNKGRVLIYPSGHECRKCLNTGYKNFDPTHPCRKCWERYSKPYGGAIVYAPRSPGFQRPLPSFRPPHIRHQHSQSQPSLFAPPPGPPSPSPSRLRRSQSSTNNNNARGPPSGPPPGGYPGAVGLSPPPPPLPPQPPMTRSLNYTRGPPPPGTTVVQPGDPRIGGRLCWRCGGDGTVSFLIFDVETCPACGGVGRIL